MTKFLNISTDTTLGGVSPADDVVVSQKAVKTYIDNQSGGGSSYTAGDGIDITSNVISIDTTVDYIIAWQNPTSSNNYTWYRKYKSGWVEQGGSQAQGTVNLPVTMADNHYTVFTQPTGSGNNPGTHVQNKTTVNFVMGNGAGWSMDWIVKGMAA